MYGILISAGIILSLFLAEDFVKKDKKSTNNLWNLSFWVLISGIIGARLYHILSLGSYYSANPIMIFEIWKGGLGVFGAIAGSLTAVAVYTKLHKKNEMYYWLDIFATVAPLAQSVGRFGNFFNRELYGFFIKIQPLFLYESLLSLLLFVFLYNLKIYNKLAEGSLSFVYLFGYSLIRLILESFRIGSWEMYGLNVAQTLSILIMVVSAVFFVRNNAKVS